MMLSHHGALDKLKLFHLEDGGFYHQSDYKMTKDIQTAKLNAAIDMLIESDADLSNVLGKEGLNDTPRSRATRYLMELLSSNK